MAYAVSHMPFRLSHENFVYMYNHECCYYSYPKLFVKSPKNTITVTQHSKQINLKKERVKSLLTNKDLQIRHFREWNGCLDTSETHPDFPRWCYDVFGIIDFISDKIKEKQNSTTKLRPDKKLSNTKFADTHVLFESLYVTSAGQRNLQNLKTKS